MGDTLNFNIVLIQPNKWPPAKIFFKKITMKNVKTQLNDYLNINVIVLSKGIILYYRYGLNTVSLDATACR